MNLDDLVKQASEAVEKMPAPSAEDLAPFQHLRADYRAAFREARGLAPSRFSSLDAVQFVKTLGERALEVLDESLNVLAPPPVDAFARGEPDDWQASQPLGPGLEMRMRFSDTAFHVDVFHAAEPMRPLQLTLSGEDGAVVAQSLGADAPTASFSLPVERPGRYHLEIEWEDSVHRLVYETRSA